MDEFTKEEIFESELYCALVRLVPKKLEDGTWAWVATDFQGSFYKNAEELEIYLNTSAKNKDDLIDFK